MTATNVVVGAASGMGAAVARELSKRNGRLVVADRNLDGTKALAAELGANTEAIECDVTDAEHVAALVKAVGSDVGALVITAGLSPTMANGRRIFEVNLIAMTRVLDAFEPSVSATTAAVCFASVAGHSVPDMAPLNAILDEPLAPDFFDKIAALGMDPDDPGTGYGVSKKGVLRLVERYALRWGPKGGRIMSLSPGIIDTPMGRQEAEQQPVMAQIVAMSPINRFAAAEEVAAVAAFLTSPAASFMTGSDVLVDGGFVAASHAAAAPVGQ
ncbi:MAG: SDR family oxidoreductase [Acidimicrobiia bacterium]